MDFSQHIHYKFGITFQHLVKMVQYIFEINIHNWVTFKI